jgi:hypothetical protein
VTAAPRRVPIGLLCLAANGLGVPAWSLFTTETTLLYRDRIFGRTP